MEQRILIIGSSRARKSILVYLLHKTYYTPLSCHILIMIIIQFKI